MEHLDDAPWKNLKMKKIRILIIGRSLWLNEVKKSFEESSKDYAIEVIEDEDEAISIGYQRKILKSKLYRTCIISICNDTTNYYNML